MNSEKKSSGITLGKIIGFLLLIGTIIVGFLMFKVFRTLTAEPARPESSVTAPNPTNNNVEVWSSDGKSLGTTSASNTEAPKAAASQTDKEEPVTEIPEEDSASLDKPATPSPAKTTERPKKSAETKTTEKKPEFKETPIEPINQKARGETPIEPIQKSQPRRPQQAEQPLQPKPVQPKRPSGGSGRTDNTLIEDNLF